MKTHLTTNTVTYSHIDSKSLREHLSYSCSREQWKILRMLSVHVHRSPRKRQIDEMNPATNDFGARQKPDKMSLFHKTTFEDRHQKDFDALHRGIFKYETPEKPTSTENGHVKNCNVKMYDGKQKCIVQRPRRDLRGSPQTGSSQRLPRRHVQRTPLYRCRRVQRTPLYRCRNDVQRTPLYRCRHVQHTPLYRCRHVQRTP